MGCLFTFLIVSIDAQNDLILSNLIQLDQFFGCLCILELFYFISSSHTIQLLLNEMSYAKSLPQHLTYHRISMNLIPSSCTQEARERRSLKGTSG